MAIDKAAADALLTTTRAVRKRLDLKRPVPREVIVECIRISQQAPTPSNSQGWRWIVVDDAKKRAGIAEIYRAAGGSYLSAASENVKSGDQTQRVLDSAVFLAQHMHEVPVLVIACLTGRAPQGFESSYYAGIYPAVWSFQLALRARGLGSVLTTLHLLKEKDVAELLGIPEDVTQAALLPVAYTIGDEFKPAERPDVEKIIHWNGW